MKFKYYFTLILCFMLSMTMNAQVNQIVPNVPQGPATVGTFDSMIYVPSLASRQGMLTPPDETVREAQDKRSQNAPGLIGDDPLSQDDALASNPNSETQSVRTAPPSLVFEAYGSGSSPTDPTMAVGPNHVFITYNTAFVIYDKSGNVLQGPTAPNPAIFPGGGCCDLTVSYDKAADRWVLTFLGASTSIAVSDGPDPINDGWYVYSQSFNDYQKLSVWSDGYYMTQNTQGSQKVFALERDEMLLGNPAAQIASFNLPGVLGTTPFFSPQFFNVSDGNMPAAGGATVVFLQDDAFAGIATDHIKYWTVDMDWGTIGNSTISAATEIPTTPFISVFDGGNFSNLTQPGGGVAIDAVQNTIMNQAQFRKFVGHNSAIFNFVVDTDGGGGELAGVRWYEFRQPGDNMPWTLYQEGTYTSPDGKHAWMGSMIMDDNGNIALGYSAMAGPTTPNPTDYRVGSYYTGRFDGDPLGTMTVIEEEIGVSTSNVPNLRYCDYNKLTIDPTSDDEFWFINEYINGPRRGIVGVFQLTPPQPNDIGMLSIDQPVSGPLTATEDIVVSIRNFGSNDIVNPEVQYTIDGGTPVVENYSGTIVAGTTESYTFTQTADLSTPQTDYDIVAKTNLPGDSNTGNDTAMKTVTNTTLGIADNEINISDLTVLTKANNQFEIIMVTGFDGVATVQVYNQLGQLLSTNSVEKQGDRYMHTLDMSSVSTGVYVIQIGDTSSNSFRTAKIVVR